MQVSNGPTNGYVLTARSGDTGGMTWEAISAVGVEGSAILSTGETGGTKYLREDGDNTSSWHDPTGKSIAMSIVFGS